MSKLITGFFSRTPNSRPNKRRKRARPKPATPDCPETESDSALRKENLVSTKSSKKTPDIDAPKSTAHYHSRKISQSFLKKHRTKFTWLETEQRQTTMRFLPTLGEFVPLDEVPFRRSMSSNKSCSSTTMPEPQPDKVESRQFVFCAPCRAFLVEDRSPSILQKPGNKSTIEELRRHRSQFAANLDNRAALQPRGWFGDSNGKLTRCLDAAIAHLKTGDFQLSRALQPGLKSIMHDATTHRRKNYIAIGVRHLNKQQTRAKSTFIGITSSARLDAVAEGSAISSFVKTGLFPNVFEQKEPESLVLPHRGVLGIGRDGAAVNGRVDALLNEHLGTKAIGHHCACHRSHLVTTRSTRKSSNCLEFRELATLLSTLVRFLDALSVRISILHETQEQLDMDPRGLDAWSPTRMNYLYHTNAQVLQRYVSVINGLQAIADERKDDRAKATGLLLKLTSVPVFYTMHLCDVIGARLVKQTKVFDADDVLMCEVHHYAQPTIETLRNAQSSKSPRERAVFDRLDRATLKYSDSIGQVELRFPGGRRASPWDSLAKVKESVFTSIISDLTALYPNKGMERLFGVFNLRLLATSNDHEHEEQLLVGLCEEFATATNTTSEFAKGDVVLPALLETGGSHVEAIDEYFDARPELARLGKSVSNGNLSHADAFEIFLGTNRDVYPRVYMLITIMILQPVNSSIIERVYAHLKEVMSPKRSRLELAQLERLLLLKLNLPDNLSGVSISEIVKSM